MARAAQTAVYVHSCFRGLSRHLGHGDVGQTPLRVAAKVAYVVPQPGTPRCSCRGRVRLSELAMFGATVEPGMRYRTKTLIANPHGAGGPDFPLIENSDCGGDSRVVAYINTVEFAPGLRAGSRTDPARRRRRGARRPRSVRRGPEFGGAGLRDRTAGVAGCLSLQSRSNPPTFGQRAFSSGFASELAGPRKSSGAFPRASPRGYPASGPLGHRAAARTSATAVLLQRRLLSVHSLRLHQAETDPHFLTPQNVVILC